MTAVWTESPSIELDLDTPPSRRYDSVPEDVIERGREVLAAISAHLPPSYPALASAAALRTMNRFTAEAKGLALRVGTDWQRVFVANLSYDLLLASLGCSTMALATPGGPVLARNMDWAPEGPLARASVKIDCVRRGDGTCRSDRRVNGRRSVARGRTSGCSRFPGAHQGRWPRLGRAAFFLLPVHRRAKSRGLARSLLPGERPAGRSPRPTSPGRSLPFESRRRKMHSQF
jgi:hypothetical protein